MKKSILFLTLLFGVLVFVFGIHLLVLEYLEKPLFEHKIVLAYIINFALAAVVLFMVERSLKSHSSQAGFIFLVGSSIKFLVFFLVFNPAYKEDGIKEAAEFATFFVPYGVCLVLEVYYLAKRLNNQST